MNSTTGFAKVGAVDLWWERLGPVDAETILLVMGAMSQATAWPPAFYTPLVEAGFGVVRFDNRDIGLSTWVDFETAPYTVGDMARDAVGLLDALDVPAAHWVGASMGGMIAQQAAIDFPQRVLTLTSIMSSPSGPYDASLPGMRPAVQEALARSADLDPVEAAVVLYRALAGPRYGFDEAAFREQARANVERGGVNPKCAHGLAVQASPSRREALASVRAPTLVLHGADDPILPVEHARATAAAIPGARLVVEEGVGHDLPAAVVGRYVQEILDLVRGRV